MGTHAEANAAPGAVDRAAKRPQQPTSIAKSLAEDFVSGGLAGIISKTTTAPVERVKLLLQLQYASAQIAPDRRYKGMVDCFRRVYSEEGLLAFWRGNTVAIMRYFPAQALNFALRDRFRSVIVGNAPVGDFKRYLFLSLLSGGASGATSLAVLYPFDFARTRVGADVGVGAQRQFTGSVDCLRKTWASEGLRGVYRGFDAALVGIVVWRAIYFGCYDALTERLLGGRRGGSLAERWAVAQFVTTVGGTTVYPIDTVRRRMMMQAGQGQKALYQSSLHCVSVVWHTEGYRGFYRGLSANLIRGMGGALLLVLYDEVREVVRRTSAPL